MIAVLPVRAGVLPTGAVETAAVAHGRVILVGSGCAEAATRLPVSGSATFLAEVGDFRPAGWSHALAQHLDPDAAVLLPASPDGRDLAARLAATTGRPLFPNALRLTDDEIVLTRHGGRVMETFQRPLDPIITLQPGATSAPQPPSRSVDARPRTETVSIRLVVGSASADAEMIRQLASDPSTIDLAEARRIVAGGAGLGSSEAFDTLGEVAVRLGASVGGTRVVMDRGWIPFERQIGTTGVVVDPELYLAFGISGAVQHTAGLGAPQHVVSVNTDPHCPMTTMADLAIVADAPAVLTALLELLAEGPGPGDGIAGEVP